MGHHHHPHHHHHHQHLHHHQHCCPLHFQCLLQVLLWMLSTGHFKNFKNLRFTSTFPSWSGWNKSLWSKSNVSLVQAECSQVGGETQQSCRGFVRLSRPDFGNILITNEQYFSLLIKILFLHFLLVSIPTVPKANPYFTRVSIIPENWLLASPCFLLVNWNLRSYSHETNFWGVIFKKEE